MTCIVGIEHAGRVYLGADSAGSTGWTLTVRADEKVFKVGPFVMGFTTSFRMGQLLRYNLTVGEPTVGCEDERFMATTFIDSVRTTLKGGGYAQVHDGQEAGGEFLVGYKGRLYQVCSDYQVGRSVSGYAAVGSGDRVALGALYATTHLPPDERIQVALDAAEQFSAGVRGPFVMMDAA